MTKKKETASDLEKLVPEVKTVELGGHVFSIYPLTVRRMANLARLLRGIAIDPENLDVMALVADNGERVIDAAVIATDEAKELIEGMDGGDFIVLAGAILKEYADFFVRRAVPAIQEAAAMVAQATAQKDGAVKE